jgi:hypothetical protein
MRFVLLPAAVRLGGMLGLRTQIAVFRVHPMVIDPVRPANLGRDRIQVRRVNVRPVSAANSIEVLVFSVFREWAKPRVAPEN